MDFSKKIGILIFASIFLFAVWPVGGYVLAFLGLLWVVQRGEGKKIVECFQRDISIWLVFLAFWLSMIFAIGQKISLAATLIFTLQVGLYLLVRVYLRKERCFQTINLLLATGLIVALVGIYQYFFSSMPTPAAWLDGDVYSSVHTRVFSTLYNPNVLGSYLVLIIALTLGSLATAKGEKRFFLYVVLVAAYLCLLFTFSRGAWMAMLISVSALFFFYPKKRIILLILLIIFLVSLPEYKNIVTRMNLELLNEDTSSVYRWQIWQGALKIIQNNWLFGVGLGNFSFALAHYLPVKSFEVLHAHNTYLQILAETGVVGFLAAGIFYGSTFFKAYHIHASSANNEISSLSLGILVALFGLLVHGMVDATLFAPQLTVFFWILAALVRNLEEIW